MSIQFLTYLAAQALPLTLTDSDQIASLQLLRATGLIAALPFRSHLHDDPACVFGFRVLAITPEGRRLLAQRRQLDEPGAHVRAETSVDAGA